MGQGRAQIKLDRQAPGATDKVHFVALNQHALDFTRDAITGVEGFDGGDLLVGPIALGRLVGESDAIRQQYRVLGDVLARVEILGKQPRRHHQGRADVREAFAGGTVDREFAGRIKRRDAGQVLDRVRVFGVGETAEHDGPRVTGVGDRDSLKRQARPIEQHLLLGHRERPLLLRRHLSAGDLLQHLFPDLGGATNIRDGRKLLQVYVTLLLLGRVAVHTGVLEDRQNLLGVVIGAEAGKRQKQSARQNNKTSKGVARIQGAHP